MALNCRNQAIALIDNWPTFGPRCKTRDGSRIHTYRCFRDHLFLSSPQAVRQWSRHIGALPQDSQYCYLDGSSRISQRPSKKWLASMARVCGMAHNGLWPRVAYYWPLSVGRLTNVDNGRLHSSRIDRRGQCVQCDITSRMMMK